MVASLEAERENCQMLTLPSSGVATSPLPETYFSGKKPPNFHTKAWRSSSLSIKKKEKQNHNKLKKKKKTTNCLENLCLLLGQPWLGWFGEGLSSCFLVSWCQQEILSLTGNAQLPSPSAGIMGEISSAPVTQHHLPSAEERRWGGRRWQPLWWK